MKGQVDHIGKVISMNPQWTTVVLVQHAACGSCAAAGLCGMSEVQEKAIQLPTDPYASYQVGDEVRVVLKASMGLKVVWLAYFLPLLLLMAVALGLFAAGASQLAAGLSAIGAVALYYLVLWLVRDRISREYVFTIQEK